MLIAYQLKVSEPGQCLIALVHVDNMDVIFDHDHTVVIGSKESFE